MKQIEITRYGNSELPNPSTRQRWTFWYSDRDHTLYLDDYYTETKPPNKRKWDTTAVYHRLDTRNNTIELENVQLPDDVVKQARDEFSQSLCVLKWMR